MVEPCSYEKYSFYKRICALKTNPPMRSIEFCWKCAKARLFQSGLAYCFGLPLTDRSDERLGFGLVGILGGDDAKQELRFGEGLHR